MILRLPKFTFLNAPSGSGKTTLAQLLCEQDSGLCHMSFAEPIRLALLATFYPDRPVDPPDLRRGDIKASSLPGTNVTHRDWMVQYSNFMKSLLGPYIFGDIAKRSVAHLSSYWPRFVFDDCRYLQEINPFSLAYGKDECTMIHVSRTGHSWSDEKFDLAGRGDFMRYEGAGHISVNNNGEPKEMLGQIERSLA